MTYDALTVYFHGIPGGAAELNLFGTDISARTSSFVPAPRDFPKGTANSDRFSLIADTLKRGYPDRTLRFVGFSLGAAAALRVSIKLGEQVESIDLISPAAPLNLGDYLKGMAGAPVFRCARDYPLAFKFLSKGQSWLAKASPATLYSALFSSAQGEDIELRDKPEFRTVMVRILEESFGSNLEIYRSEVASYVDDWTHVLDQVYQPVSIHHGRCDNWSPVQMATDLAASLKNCRSLDMDDGLSHYSMLKAFLQQG